MNYLLNHAWEGYCRVNNIKEYIVAPFEKDDDLFNNKYFNHLMNGGKFFHVLCQESGVAIPAIKE